LQEEVLELHEAWSNEDIVEVADAITDCLYILFGTAIEFGLQDKLEALFDEVHGSNMSKLDENGKPIYRNDGKVLKSENYYKPNLKKIING
jgi:predicted HAD superfamily Cof-like phosphohydrolase